LPSMLDKLGVTGSSPVPPTLIEALHMRRFPRLMRSHANVARMCRGKEMARLSLVKARRAVARGAARAKICEGESGPPPDEASATPDMPAGVLGFACWPQRHGPGPTAHWTRCRSRPGERTNASHGVRLFSLCSSCYLRAERAPTLLRNPALLLHPKSAFLQPRPPRLPTRGVPCIRSDVDLRSSVNSRLGTPAVSPASPTSSARSRSSTGKRSAREQPFL
jgi:hypothetical protein